MKRCLAPLAKGACSLLACLALAVACVPLGHAQASALTPEETELSGMELLSQEEPSASQVLHEYFQSRAQEVLGHKGAAANDGLELSRCVAAASRMRTQGFQELEEAAQLVVVDASSQATVQSVSWDAGSLRVTAYEEVTMDYGYGQGASATASATDQARFGTWHQLTLTEQDGTWQVSQDLFDEDDLCGVNTAASRMQPLATSSSTSTVELFADYDPQAAMDYADTYWKNYNPAYRNFNEIGGDCANFVSQCMQAGGLPTVDKGYSSASSWYYRTGKDYSESWTYCPTFVKHLKTRGRYVINPKRTEVFPGSPVVYMPENTWSHAVICVGYNSQGIPIINGHNNDRYHMPYNYFDVTRCTIQLTETADSNLGFLTGEDGRWMDDVLLGGTQSGLEQCFKWRQLSDDEVYLQSYLGSSSQVVLPDTVERWYADGSRQVFKVRSVGADAFRNCSLLTSVHIPPNVSVIEKAAFRNCKNLQEVTGCEGLRSVEEAGFMYCRSLRSLPSLEGLRYARAYSFYDCRSLTALPKLPALRVVYKKSFCKTGISSLPSMPALKAVGEAAFAQCPNLKKAHLDSQVLTKIYPGAFKYCPQLAKAYLTSPKLYKVYRYQFYKCPKLKTVSIRSQKLTRKYVSTKFFKGCNPTVKVWLLPAKYSSYSSLLRFSGLSSRAKLVRLKS